MYIFHVVYKKQVMNHTATHLKTTKQFEPYYMHLFFYNTLPPDVPQTKQRRIQKYKMNETHNIIVGLW